jgi:hypothetical protein
MLIAALQKYAFNHRCRPRFDLLLTGAGFLFSLGPDAGVRRPSTARLRLVKPLRALAFFVMRLILEGAGCVWRVSAVVVLVRALGNDVMPDRDGDHEIRELSVDRTRIVRTYTTWSIFRGF